MGDARRLHPEPINLSRVALIRERTLAELASPARVEALLLELGLNGEGLSELPPELHAHCGGLRIWQYPTQFGRYLVQLSRLGVRSYLEIGIRHGGSFVATAEYLERFRPSISPSASTSSIARRWRSIARATARRASGAQHAVARVS